jgi:tRNA A-37 threonylcarbamoyl transferase component Bud32
MEDSTTIDQRWATLTAVGGPTGDPDATHRPADPATAATLVASAAATLVAAPVTAATLIAAPATVATVIAGADATTVATAPAAGGGATMPGLSYDLVGELGRGGMGVVYRARQRSLARDVALKFIHPHAAQGGGRERFIAEALVNGLLDHPNIVPVHDLGSTGTGDCFLAMKLIDGRSWKALLHPKTEADRAAAAGYDLDRHLAVLQSVGHAIAFAHSRGIIHRDLKPENVMVGQFGEVLVMDWGIAVDIREQAGDDQRTLHKSQATMPAGTPSYMSPEQAEGRGEDLGPWTDVYLLGAILCELLTGSAPHRGGTLIEVVRKAALSAPPVLPASVPEGLAAIVRTALARDHRQRYPTVAAFQAALTAFSRHAAADRLCAVADDRLREAATVAGAARYAAFDEALAGYRQSLVLWPDGARAAAGLATGRLAYARAALDAGDLGLAETQLASASSDEADRLRSRLRAAQAAAADRERTARRLRRGLIAASAAIVLGLAGGLLLINRERQATANQRDRALSAEGAARTAEGAAIAARDQAQAAERTAVAAEADTRRQLARSALAFRDTAEQSGRRGVGLLWSLRACDLVRDDAVALADCRLGAALRLAELPAVLGACTVEAAGGGRSTIQLAVPLADGRIVIAGHIMADLDGSGPPALGLAAPGATLARLDPVAPTGDALWAVDAARSRVLLLTESGLRVFTIGDAIVARPAGDGRPTAPGSGSALLALGDGLHVAASHPQSGVEILDLDGNGIEHIALEGDDLACAEQSVGLAAWTADRLRWWDGSTVQDLPMPPGDGPVRAVTVDARRLVVWRSDDLWQSRRTGDAWGPAQRIEDIPDISASNQPHLPPAGDRLRLVGDDGIRIGGVYRPATLVTLRSEGARLRSSQTPASAEVTAWERRRDLARRLAGHLAEDGMVEASDPAAVPVAVGDGRAVTWTRQQVVRLSPTLPLHPQAATITWQRRDPIDRWRWAMMPWRIDGSAMTTLTADGKESTIALPDGRWTITGSDRWLTGIDEDGRVLLVDLAERTTAVVRLPTAEGWPASAIAATASADGRYLLAMRLTVDGRRALWRCDRTAQAWTGPVALPAIAYDDELIAPPESDSAAWLLHDDGQTAWLRIGYHRWQPVDLRDGATGRVVLTPDIGHHRRWRDRDIAAINAWTADGTHRQLLAQALDVDSRYAGILQVAELVVPGIITQRLVGGLPILPGGGGLDLAADGNRFAIAGGPQPPGWLPTGVDRRSPQTGAALRSRGLLLGSGELRRVIGDLPRTIAGSAWPEDAAITGLRWLGRDALLLRIEQDADVAFARLDLTAGDPAAAWDAVMLLTGSRLDLSEECVPLDAETVRVVADRVQAQAPAR